MSTAAATLRQLVIIVIDKIVEGDLRLLLANALESSPFQTGRHNRLALRCATRSPSSRTYACWETASICSPSNSNISTLIFVVDLIESVLTNYHNSSARGTSLSAHIHTCCPPSTAVISKSSRALSLIMTPSPHCSSERSAFSPHAPQHMHHFSLTQAILAELATDAEMFPTLLIKTRPWRDSACETRPGWMRVFAMEIMRGCVFLLSLIARCQVYMYMRPRI